MAEDGAVPVGKTIKRWRRFRGMTQEALGAAAKRHAGTISRVERGVHNPDLATIEAIAQVLGTSAASVLAGVEPDPNGEPAGQAVGT